jgi:hypothetical protein
MSQRKSKRHLEFESLEVMELLSGAGMAVPDAGIPHHVAQVHRATKGAVGDVELILSGTLEGPYYALGGGSTFGFTGRGTVNPIGKAQLQGKIDLSTPSTSGQLTLDFGKRGKVFAAVTGPTGGPYHYQITGGTRTFAGDTGSGSALLSYRPSNAAQTRGHFALTLVPPTS